MGSQGLRAVIAAIALAAPLAIAGPGAALIGGTPGSPAQGLAQLEAGGARVCAATIITPGWALTAGHCLDESPQALRLIADPTRALSLGAAIPGPPGTDLALIEVPDTARSGAPVTAARSFSASCSMQQRDVTIAGAAHVPGSGLTRTASSAGAWLYDECSPDLYDAMLVIGPDRPSVSICAGDSGSPVLGPDGTVHAVLVAAVAGPGNGACGASRDAIGFAETLNTAARQAWLQRTAVAPRPLPRPTAVVARASRAKVWLAVGPRRGAPAPGSVVSVLRSNGRVWARARVGSTGLIPVRRPPAGAYRIRLESPGGTRLTPPVRIRQWNGRRPVWRGPAADVIIVTSSATRAG